MPNIILSPGLQLLIPSDTLPDAGTCYVSSLTLHDGNKEIHAIDDHVLFVDVTKFQRMSAARAIDGSGPSILYTSSLASCFPVLFKFRNGDVALYHGNSGATKQLKVYLDDPELDEIQVFGKGVGLNKAKVDLFVANLQTYYGVLEGHHQPVLNVAKQSTNYGRVFCSINQAGELTVILGPEHAHHHQAAVNYTFQAQPVRSRADILRIDKLKSTYYAHAIQDGQEGRYHFFPVKADDTQNLKPEFRGLKGDLLKTKILEDFKKQIEAATTSKELDELVGNLQQSEEYKILAKNQRFLPSFSSKPNGAIRAFNLMVEEHQGTINSRDSLLKDLGINP